jgi:hypothetical protein
VAVGINGADHSWENRQYSSIYIDTKWGVAGPALVYICPIRRLC